MISRDAIVRIAELSIEARHVDEYRKFLAEEIDASVDTEPGVLMLHAVALRDDSTKIRLLEVYADQTSYEQHLRSPHFLKYKTSTAHMVASLKLLETDSIRLRSKNLEE